MKKKTGGRRHSMESGRKWKVEDRSYSGKEDRRKKVKKETGKYKV